MKNLRLKALLGATALVAVTAAANAGGFSRGNADTDILFEQGNFNMRSSVTYVAPERTYTSGPNNIGTDYADNYAVFSGAAKFKITDALSCAGTVAEPYGASLTYNVPKISTSVLLGKKHEEFTVTEFGATCAVGFDLSKGRISFLAGAFVENFDYELQVRGNPSLPTASQMIDVSLNGTAGGWRAGLAYEIPEIALRAQLMYRSGTSHNPTGDASSSGPLTNPTPNPFQPFAPTGTSSGAGELPQSVELKLQTGVAPGWLVYGNVKWTDWSVTKTLLLSTNMGFNSFNPYYWRDGWTVTGGVGHAFNDWLSGTVFFTWDRGVGTGWDLSAETYTLGAGASVKDKLGGELRFGGAVSYLGAITETKNGTLPASTPGVNPFPAAIDTNYGVGSDWAYALSAGYAIKW